MVLLLREQRHAKEIAHERKHFWEPTRDAALASILEGKGGDASLALPRPPLDATLSSRLLRGEATAADVATIKRLTRSSIWLFSSSTFKASFGCVDKMRSSSLFSLSCALNSLISVAPSSPFFVLVFLISRTPRSSATT